ncbi:hypothetical protein HYC85_009947 [Camellia sinensis]|uniref:Uncharacterized protein n=1 Tax=Camellia sinensis TaxID=4442 RepID=A0A7J7HGM7_CAMSI|nr:hypothetical protein HYC85_009947 [Camellia sinensis]
MASQFSVLPTLLFVLLMIATGIRLSECTNFTILNNCKETIWPGITANDNLTSDNANPPYSPPRLVGAVAYGAAPGCNFDKNNVGTCQTGSCGTTLKCFGPGQPPFSIAEFTLGQVDYYDVSLVDGFNLPVVITPVNGKGNCSVAGCESDLRSKCPPELALVSSGKTIACRSACNVFNTDEYCCRGAYSDPVSCVPTNYSKIFKQACPVAYSYAHDDPTSVLTCSTTDYIVTFCPSKNQTQCTYHNKKLVCSRSGSESDGLNSKAFFQRWWILMLPIATNTHLFTILIGRPFHLAVLDHYDLGFVSNRVPNGTGWTATLPKPVSEVPSPQRNLHKSSTGNGESPSEPSDEQSLIPKCNFSPMKGIKKKTVVVRDRRGEDRPESGRRPTVKRADHEGWPRGETDRKEG